MESKGLSKARDFWFNNLRHLLDIQMDTEKSWIHTLKTQMYPDDAKMFDLHLTHSFMAFCLRESSEDESLLTQNAYDIFEGPSPTTMNLCTGIKEAVVYNEYHNFAPVSPRLIIILRSHLLSQLRQDSGFRYVWGLLANVVRSRHLCPDKAGSLLQDLPLSPCKTVYMRPVSSSTDFFSQRGSIPIFVLQAVSGAYHNHQQPSSGGSVSHLLNSLSPSKIAEIQYRELIQGRI
jgi:hypothetical protein